MAKYSLPILGTILTKCKHPNVVAMFRTYIANFGNGIAYSEYRQYKQSWFNIVLLLGIIRQQKWRHISRILIFLFGKTHAIPER